MTSSKYSGAFRPTGAKVSETEMVQAQEPEDRGVDIVDVGGAFDGALPDFIGGADSLTAPDTASGKPHGEAPGVVIATVTFLVKRRATEFPAPDDERVLQHAPAFEVFEEACDGFIGGFAPLAVIGFEVGVRVPAGAGTTVNFDETHATFDEAPGEQDVATEDGGFGLVEAIERVGFFGFGCDIDGFGAGFSGARRRVQSLEMDPWEQKDVANDPAYAGVLRELQASLAGQMQKTQDPILRGAVTSPLHRKSQAWLLGKG